MKRIEFLTEKKISRITHYDPINNGNIKIFINDKQVGFVKTMRLHADLSFGYIRASIKIIKRGNDEATFASRTEGGDVGFDEINPDMEDSLILEKIVDDGKYTKFYLRTIITV